MLIRTEVDHGGVGAAVPGLTAVSPPIPHLAYVLGFAAKYTGNWSRPTFAVEAGLSAIASSVLSTNYSAAARN